MAGGDGHARTTGTAQVREPQAVALGLREPEDVGAAVGAPQPAQSAVPGPAAEQGSGEGSAESVEVRCPVGRGGILLKLLRTGAATIGEGNLIEVACGECRRAERQRGREVLLVLHRFGMDGEHVETVTV
jgi:hypothetical protein